MKNGITVFRVFEATNDFRNVEVAAKAVKEFGGEAHVEVNYTISPVHTLEKWMEYAEQVLEIGADWLSLKDATGILMPFDAYRIIKGMKDRAKGKLPVLLHCHDMSGASSMCHMMALLAGVDMIDTVLSPLAFGSSHPATETMIAALKDTPFDTGIDLKLLEEPTRITRDIGEKYSEYTTKYAGVNAEVLKHKMPGGMISNMVAAVERGWPDGSDGGGPQRKSECGEGPGLSAAPDSHEPDRRLPSGIQCADGREIPNHHARGHGLCRG